MKKGWNSHQMKWQNRIERMSGIQILQEIRQIKSKIRDKSLIILDHHMLHYFSFINEYYSINYGKERYQRHLRIFK